MSQRAVYEAGMAGESLFDRLSPRADERQTSAVDRSMAIVLRNLFREESALLSIGRFEIVRTLGRGGTGAVYEAFDPLRRERTALKILHGRGPSQLYRLKREFRALAALRHPNLVALHELSVAHEDPFFTMDLIEGVDFVTYVRSGSSADGRAHDARLRAALLQLGEGVHALHAAGKLHCDIKPSNVLVEAGGRVVLLDFGLVHDARDEGRHAAEGTPAYMAPEQARGAACEASDWYSFGLVLRDALGDAGSHGSALAQLAARLLEPEPARRPGFDEITAIVGGAPQRRAEPRAASGKPAPFVGRKAELRRLEDALVCSRQQPCLLLVRGEAGAGKSALLSEFVRVALAPAQALVLSGHCYEREAVPYKALDSIVDELSRHLMSVPSTAAALPSPADRAALLHVFPVLGRVEWLRDGAVQPAIHPVELRARAFSALKRIFVQLAAERPLVLRIEDLQWSDADSGRLLGALLCEEDSPAMLVVASDRTDARLVNPTIEELRTVSELAPRPLAVAELELGTLLPDEALALAGLLLDGHTPAHGAAQLAAESRGNPLLLTELARFVVEGSRDADFELPSIEALLQRRIEPLSLESRLVLELLAAAGRPLPAGVVARAAGLDGDAYAELGALRAARLAHAIARGGDELFVLEHDRIGEVVLNAIDEDARSALHGRLARAIALDPRAQPELLIEQYVGARMPLEAARCARGAADHALASLAFARSAQLYEHALELAAWSADERAELHRNHAVALEHSGRTLAAASAFARAAELTGEPFAAAQLEQRAAETAHAQRRLPRWRARAAQGLCASGVALARGARRRWPSRSRDCSFRNASAGSSGGARAKRCAVRARSSWLAPARASRTTTCRARSTTRCSASTRASGCPIRCGTRGRAVRGDCCGPSCSGPFGVRRGLRQLEGACAAAARARRS